MRWINTKAFMATCAVVAVIAVGTVAGLVLSSNSKPAYHPHRPAPVSSPVAAPVHRGPLRSPFTGERVKNLGPELIFKIDNIVLARPQTGLTSADIIYVLPVEGGLTRFMAVFSSHIPAVVGPVRSARQDDTELLAQYGRPAFAFSGAAPRLLPIVEHARIIDLYAGRVGGYYRNYNRIAPYNLYADTHTLLREAKGASKARNIGFHFGNAAPAGGRPVRSVTVRYPAATYTFQWVKDKGWHVFIDGAPAIMTNGRQLSPPTVVIQYVVVGLSPFREWGNLRPPYAVSVGSGRALVLRNGKEYLVHWSRPQRNVGTSFTFEGKPMNFAPGQVWIVLTGLSRRSFFDETQ